MSKRGGWWFAFCAVLGGGVLLALQLLYLAHDRTDQLNSYEHQDFQLLLTVVHDLPTADFTVHLHHAADEYSAFIAATAAIARLAGFQLWVLLVLPMLGWALMVDVGYRIAQRLSGDRQAARLAAAVIALSPIAFGLARRFTPWTLIMADYLAVVYFAMLLADRPSLVLALLLGSAATLGVFLPHEVTPLMTYLFHVSVPLAWTFVMVTRHPDRRWPRKVLYLGVIAVMLGAALVYWQHKRILFNFSYGGYVSNEWNRYAGSSEPGMGVFDYLPVLGRNLLGPIGFVFCFVGLAAYPFFRQRKRDLFWLIYPLALLVVMSVIPKKNPWYILDFVPLMLIVASVAIAAWLKKAGRAKGALVVALWLGGLLLQFGWMSFLPWVRLGRLEQYRPWLTNSPQMVAREFSDDFTGTPSYLEQTGGFTARAAALFPGKKEIHLGLLSDMVGYYTVPYYLRTSGTRFVLHDLLAHPAERMLRLDGVLLLTIPKPDAMRSALRPDLAAAEAELIVRDYADGLPGDEERRVRARENGRRLLSYLPQWRRTDLFPGVTVWRPPGAVIP